MVISFMLYALKIFFRTNGKNILNINAHKQSGNKSFVKEIHCINVSLRSDFII